MKVLHVVPTYVPAFRYGGPVRSVFGLAEALGRAGAKVEVWTTDLDGSERLDVPKGTPVRYPHHVARYFPVEAFRRWHWSLELGSAFGDADAEVVHLHSVFLYPTWVARRWVVARGIPYLLSPRGMIDPELIVARGALRKWLWLRLFEKGTLRGASRIVVSSPFEAKRIQESGLAVRPLEELPNGVDLIEWGPPARESISVSIQAEITRGSFVLFLGRLDPKKGLELLLGALAKIDSLRLVVAGADQNGMAEKLLASARELSLSDRFSYVGPVKGADRVALLRAALALVLPSSSENFGNVVVEAMACEVPVLTTERVGASVHVKRAGAGWVIPLASVEALVGKLQEIRDRPVAELKRRGEEGRKYVERELTWDRVAVRAIELYRRVQLENSR